MSKEDWIIGILAAYGTLDLLGHLLQLITFGSI